jgi:outer membrane protein assembly factor BamA
MPTIAFIIILFGQLLFLPSSYARGTLSEKELENKKEGWFPTGLPILLYNSDLGFGYGAIVIFYNNGSRADERFSYTPYLFQIGALIQNTTKGMFNYEAQLDSPYILGSRFRLRANMGFIRLLYDNYFGIGDESYRPLAGNYPIMQDSLSYLENKGNGQGLTYNRYYNYTKKLIYERVTLERELVGNFKFLLGNGIGKYDIITFDGKATDLKNGTFTQGTTLISQDKPLGYTGGLTNYISLGIVYDSRDFEPDPNRGLFTDLTYEIYTKYLGSDYEFQRLSYGLRLFVSPLQDLVLALRGAFAATTGSVPFFEMTYIGLSDKRIEALGGITSVKGFSQRRFIGKSVSFANMEIRYRFVDFHLGSELFKLIAVPFYDIGRAFDDISDFHIDQSWRGAYGFALRISWNLNFLINLSYGVSQEDKYAAIDIFHPF